MRVFVSTVSEIKVYIYIYCYVVWDKIFAGGLSLFYSGVTTSVTGQSKYKPLIGQVVHHTGK